MTDILKGLYIVATPIGNYNDLSIRALSILKQVDLIICEDSRVTNKLLSFYGIKKTMLVYNDNTTSREREHIIDKLKENKSLALVSDAGTPLISDPGYKLINAIYHENIAVTTIPGPCAFVAALTLSGLPTNRFLFEGFLPSKQSGRIKALMELKFIEATLIFYEAPHRLVESLTDMNEVLGNRKACVLREITKTFEEVKRDDLIELVKYYSTEGICKGEITIIIGPPEEKTIDENEIDNMLKNLLETMSLKDAVNIVSDASGLKKKDVYNRALIISGRK